jgi:ribosomal-protein-alanine N-acetyltransferase
MNERIRKDYMSGNSIHWVISSVLSGEVLGTCGFYRGFQDDIGEIGYVLKKAYQGQGYMAEAISLMLDFGFKELKLKAIRGLTSHTNQASINVLRRAGFKMSETVDDEITFLVSSSF